jgi:hypothetical protein
LALANNVSEAVESSQSASSSTVSWRALSLAKLDAAGGAPTGA